ncbi:MAG: NERD domain-containing protein [Anaerolineales bacterium]|nr:NERD domain-containing protein [Anaerolineales bacterium]
MKTKKRSPLKDRPLRYAGQSLNEQIEDRLLDLLYWFFLPAMTIVLVIGEWFRFLNPQPAQKPILVTFVAIVLLGVGIFKIFKGIKEVNRLKMARDGEKIVAEELQTLLKDGATVFHDVIGNKFNIDHVIVSKHGIFLVETKTYSKPIKKDAVISFDENHLYVDGQKIQRGPIKQVKALVKWLQDLLLQTTGQKFPIHPVILFPGWYTEQIKRGQELWILNPKALPKFIANEPIKIKETDVHLIAYHLSRYIRTHEVK